MVQVRHLLEAKGHVVHTARPDETVLVALQRMAEHHIGALLVIGDGDLLGVISERDYARKVVLKGRSSRETPIGEVMALPVTVTPEAGVEECMALCTERRVRHLPVIADGVIVGVVSIGDLVKAVIDEQAQEIEHLQRYIAG